MIIPLGQVSLYMALLLAALAGVSFVLAAARRDMLAARTGRDAIVGCALIVWLAVGALAAAFVQNDFRLQYVASYSDSTLPLAYRISALWAGPEGSLLLWTALAATVASALMLSRPLDRGLAASGALSAAILLLFLIVLNLDRSPHAGTAAGRWPFAATPFAPVEIIPLDGNGLKLQLQTWAMAVHPPVLFAGYALLAGPFAIALGNLITGRSVRTRTGLAANLDVLRRFLLLGWAFLTAGIALGAWWAYTELGWGGYWAWDPVESASLVPWLVATAAIHALSATRRHGRLHGTALTLAALGFLACLAATYITRGGFVQSVHAYAATPQSGLMDWLLAKAYPGFILMALVLLAVLLFLRRPGRRPPSDASDTASASTACLAGSRAESMRTVLTCSMAVVLVVFAAAVLTGTLLPAFLKELAGISYGLAPERFNQLAAVFGLILLVLLATSAILAARRRKPAGLKSPGGAAVLAAHLGFVIMAVGLAGSHLVKDDVRAHLERGESVQFAGYMIRHEGLAKVRSESRPQVFVNASLSLRRGNGPADVIKPGFTFDLSHDDQRGNVAVRPGWFQDLVVSLDEYDLASQKITLLLHRTGLVAWLWSGAGLLVLAGLAAALWPSKAGRAEAKSA